MTVLGRKIRSLREERGLTQAQLAQIVRVKRQYINNVENGYQLPSERLLVSLADTLKISLKDLKELLEDDRLERKIKKLGLKEPEFVLMFKELPKMTATC